MDGAGCSNSSSSPGAPNVMAGPSCTAARPFWAKLVPADPLHPEVDIHVDDPVVSSQVVDGYPESLAWCEIRRSANSDGTSTAIIRNLSSTAIIVDGNIIEEDMVANIKSGSEITAGPKCEGFMTYVLEIISVTRTDDSNIKDLKVSLDVEHAKCSICLNVWHDVVTVSPCFHNFCNGCFSEWLRRSSTSSRDKTKKVACPQCRTEVQCIGKNHFLHTIEEAILREFPSLKRSAEEITLLDSYASIRSAIELGKRKNPSRKRTHSYSATSVDNLPCPQCGTELGGFRCTPGVAHLVCEGCGGMMPSRQNIDITQQCLGCDKAFCAAYWRSHGVSSADYNLICSPDSFEMISARVISQIPDSVHEGNAYERDITERCIQRTGKTLQAVISDWIIKFDNKEIDRSTLRLNHGESITARTYICNGCFDKFVDYLLYWFRITMPSSVYPGDAAERENCWYGNTCRTQHHNSEHARKRNHVCRPTRGNNMSSSS